MYQYFIPFYGEIITYMYYMTPICIVIHLSIYPLIHLLMGIWLFPPFGAVNSAALNKNVHIFVNTVQSFRGVYLGAELRCHMVTACLIFEELPILSQVASQFTILPPTKQDLRV